MINNENAYIMCMHHVHVYMMYVWLYLLWIEIIIIIIVCFMIIGLRINTFFAIILESYTQTQTDFSVTKG